MATNAYPDFSGKHVCFYLSGRAKRSYMLQDVSFEMQAGRVFIVGRVSEAYEDDVWSKGFPIGIAWDAVEQYLIYDSAENYERELARFDEVRTARKTEKKLARKQQSKGE